VTNLATLVGHGLWLEQIKAIGVTLMLSISATAILGYAIKAVLGLRPSVEVEESGLDDADHGEAGYHGDESGHVGHEPNRLDSSLGDKVGLAAHG